MRKWQILEFDGNPYYAFVPEDDEPIKEEAIPELQEESAALEQELNVSQESEDRKEEDEQDDKADNRSVDEETVPEEYIERLEEEIEEQDIKPVIINGNLQAPESQEAEEEEEEQIDNSQAEVYQVKVEGGVVMLEKLNVEAIETTDQDENHTVVLAESGDHPDEESQDVLGFEQEDDDEVVATIEEDVVEPEETEEFRGTTSKTGSGGSLKCRACSETFESTLAFRKHVAWTHKKKVCIVEDGAYICSVCDYRTLKKSQFAAHLQRQHETWQRKRQSSSSAMFPCAACGFVCRSKHSLQSHFIRKHTDRYEHQCKFCPKKFKVKGDLTNHVRFHHKEKPVHCDVCGKLCLNSGSLYVHQKWAHYKPKFECTICKRRMVTQENLDQHMVMQHEKREKIVCAECGKTFTKKDSFKRHMAVHTGNKPYNCVICNKPFARRSQLRQHLLIHTGKRPFVCDICGKAFTQKPGLICHRKTHPGTHPPLPVMPIGDIVKEFTEGFLKNHPQGAELGEDHDDLEDEEEEEEEYEEEEIDREEIVKSEVVEENVVHEGMEE